MSQPAIEPAVFHLPFAADYPDEPATAMIERGRALGVFTTQATPPSAAPAYQPPVPSTPAEIVQRQLTTLLTTFDGDVAKDPDQIRRFVTNNLIRLSVEAKNESTQVKCLEMLGKHKDVGLFEERSFIKIANMDTDTLKAELKALSDRLRTLMPSQQNQQPITTIEPDAITPVKETPHAEAN